MNSATATSPHNPIQETASINLENSRTTTEESNNRSLWSRIKLFFGNISNRVSSLFNSLRSPITQFFTKNFCWSRTDSATSSEPAPRTSLSNPPSLSLSSSSRSYSSSSSASSLSSSLSTPLSERSSNLSETTSIHSEDSEGSDAHLSLDSIDSDTETETVTANNLPEKNPSTVVRGRICPNGDVEFRMSSLPEDLISESSAGSTSMDCLDEMDMDTLKFMDNVGIQREKAERPIIEGMEIVVNSPITTITVNDAASDTSDESSEDWMSAHSTFSECSDDINQSAIETSQPIRQQQPVEDVNQLFSDVFRMLAKEVPESILNHAITHKILDRNQIIPIIQALLKVMDAPSTTRDDLIKLEYLFSYDNDLKGLLAARIDAASESSNRSINKPTPEPLTNA